MGTKQPYLLKYDTNTVELEEILTQLKAIKKLVIQAAWQVKEHLGSFKIQIPFKTLA